MVRRAIVRVKGIVQGVGFRPFVYRLATRYNLKGFVLNDGQGVLIDVEGDEKSISEFVQSLEKEKPTQARISQIGLEYVDSLQGYTNFTIQESQQQGKKDVSIPPDISVCDRCVKETLDIDNRRYLYPFTSCTYCGPRFSIIRKIPYDRDNTSMKDFSMCPDCEREYSSPDNHRFHSQINTCPACGPEVFLYKDKTLLEKSYKAIQTAARLIKDGFIIAVKGIGGFHLVCDATNHDAVKRLRDRKRRDKKPFAVMCKDLEMVKRYVKINRFEEKTILSSPKPIVLANKTQDLEISPLVAPDIDLLGVLLPYTSLHNLLFLNLDIPLVFTSANLSEEPMVKDNQEAFDRLSYLADYLLVHNVDILNRVDDSVVFYIEDRRFFVRKARGYAPSTLNLPFKIDRNVLAVGGHQKVTISVAFDDKVVVSQHIGDMDSPESRDVFEETVVKFLEVYQISPDVVVSDMHPSYFTTKWAEEFSRKYNINHLKVQHHHAHAMSVMLDTQTEERFLAVCWDGTGYGVDGHLWGGEFLVVNLDGFERVLSFKEFKLIGGEEAIKQPERVAISMLFEILGKDAVKLVKHLPEERLELFYKMWNRGLNSPYSSSVGRLFDAVAWLTGMVDRLSYEGQSGLLMEKFYDVNIRDAYPFFIKDGVIDWRDMVLGVIQDRVDRILAVSKFINTLCKVVVDVASTYNLPVGLTGGVFQNRVLVRKIIEMANGRNIKLLLHRNLPPNDGGISAGQVMAVVKMVK